MPTPFVFDLEESQRLVEARGEFLRRFVTDFKDRLELRTALDAGCGVGHFSSLLQQIGLRVTAFDARAENVEEARRRNPGVDFRVADAEELQPQEFGVFDLVLCFGLLYHLENPLRAARRLRAMTGKVLLIESVCVPGKAPLFHLRDEAALHDQALNAVACYPSEGALVKMAYRAGFPAVYRPARSPGHEDFQGRTGRRPWRTVLVAPVSPIQDASLVLADEPSGRADLWSSDPTGLLKMGRRLQAFLKRPWAENWARLRRRYGSAGK
ncbi:MAG: class I SAM-dependent methyltransferase [Terriglobales bacterium]